MASTIQGDKEEEEEAVWGLASEHFYPKKQICKLLGDSWFIDIVMKSPLSFLGLRLHPELGNSPATSIKAGRNSQRHLLSQALWVGGMEHLKSEPMSGPFLDLKKERIQHTLYQQVTQGLLSWSPLTRLFLGC